MMSKEVRRPSGCKEDGQADGRTEGHRLEGERSDRRMEGHEACQFTVGSRQHSELGLKI